MLGLLGTKRKEWTAGSLNLLPGIVHKPLALITNFPKSPPRNIKYSPLWYSVVCWEYSIFGGGGWGAGLLLGEGIAFFALVLDMAVA